LRKDDKAVLARTIGKEKLIGKNGNINCNTNGNNNNGRSGEKTKSS